VTTDARFLAKRLADDHASLEVAAAVAAKILAPPRLIGVTGYAQNGKDTVGKRLVEEHGYTRFAFADALKSMALVLDPLVNSEEWGEHVRLSRMVEYGGWESAKRDPEVRRFLQVLGTEAVRNHIGEDSWVRATERAIAEARMSGDADRVVITDVRFPNEAAWIFAQGGKLVRVNRVEPDGSQFDNGLPIDHVSEKFVTTLTADYVITAVSGDVDGLLNAVDELVRR
jgi:hypothetical protein